MLSSLVLSLLALGAPQQIPVPERPRDPWVFRSVLDGKVRIVTLALSKDMWVAYDATTCGLYKAWKGSVDFEGAVYTTEHGPQPRSFGPAYTHGLAGDVWEAEVAGERVAARALWRGYGLHAGRASLRYDVVLPDGRAIGVRETPEQVFAEALFTPEQIDEWVLTPGHPCLLRSFAAPEIPADVKLSVRVRVDGVSAKLGEALEREQRIDVAQADGTVAQQDVAHLVLTAQKPTNNLMLFFAPLPEPVREPEATDAAGAAGARATNGAEGGRK